LCHDPLTILLGSSALDLRTPDLQNQVSLKELNLSSRDPCNLFFGFASLPEDEGGIVIGDLQGIYTIVLWLLLSATPNGALLASSFGSFGAGDEAFGLAAST